ncbi:BLOC-2 complex member HPS3 [Aplochiton taeniatus]
MVHVYSCHPFASQQIVPAEQEPGLMCCGGGALFVVATGGCKVEAYGMGQEGCPLICRFATMGTVKSIRHSNIGDYLVTIEEKNSATYLRAYTNWRYQAQEKARVGVRLLGHLLRGAALHGAPKEQMEIIEIPLWEHPLAVACCPVTGDLLVGCPRTLGLFTLKRQSQQQTAPNQSISVLDFERSLILHLPGLTPQQVALCSGYIAVQSELEVLVLKLDTIPDLKNKQIAASLDTHTEGCETNQDPDGFLFLPRHQELLGGRARECGLEVILEQTGLDERGTFTFTYILYRRFAPDFFQGCSVEEMRLHSLQLHPVFTGNGDACGGEEPACVFCFCSLPTTGYLYSLRGGVELLSAYQYPEKAQEAALTDHFLHVITKNALQCFTVRCAAVAARAKDPYIDTTMKACPPSSLEVCALRIQLFIGLRTLCVDGRRVALLSAADIDTPEETERSARRELEFKEHTTLTGIFLAVGIEPSNTPALESFLSRPFLNRKWSRPKEPSAVGAGHGWNLYVVDTVSPLALYEEMVEYSGRYEETNCLHLLSEAHLLLRASLLQTRPAHTHPDTHTNRRELEDAFRQSCAQLGDCYSRSDQKHCHLALPYYRMSGLSVTDVIARNHPLPSSPGFYGPGFLFYLRHFLLEETREILSQETADNVVEIFSQSEPSQLVGVCASRCMVLASPASALSRLRRLEAATAVSVPLTVTMATMALRMADQPAYRQLMERHAEMLQVYGFIEEPRLLLHTGVQDTPTHSTTHTPYEDTHTHVRTHPPPEVLQPHPTVLALHLSATQPGLLVASMVALQQNYKVKLEQADTVFKELGCEDSLLVDFWEGMLMASSQEAVIQELLFRLASVYIDRLTPPQAPPPQAPSPQAPPTQAPTPEVQGRSRSLKTADDLISSCSHYGGLFPWVSVLTPPSTKPNMEQEALHKLQSVLCGPSLEVCSILPLLDGVSEDTMEGLSLHLLCSTRQGHYESSMEKLLDRCPQAIIPYANHQLQDTHMSLWWQKLLPELCDRTRTSPENSILLAALKETLVVVAMEMSPLEFLELLPDDGTAQYFLPHILACSQRQLIA